MPKLIALIQFFALNLFFLMVVMGSIKLSANDAAALNYYLVALPFLLAWWALRYDVRKKTMVDLE